MTLLSLFNQNQSYSAEDLRALAAIFRSEGVLTGFDYTVNTSTQLTFDPGVCIAYYDNNTPDEPYYFIRSDDDEAITSITAPAGGTDYKTYIFYAAADDSYVDGSGGDTPTISSVSDTSTGSYNDPTLPDNSVPLLKVQMRNTDTLNTGSPVFTDMREAPLAWNDSGWNTYTPTWTNVTIGNGSTTARWRRIGDMIEINGYILWGSTTSANSSEWSMSTPFLPDLGHGHSYMSDSMALDYSESRYYMVQARTITGQRLIKFFNHTQYSTSYVVGQHITQSQPFTWAEDDSLTVTFRYRTSEPFFAEATT